jgi:integrase
MTGSSVPLGPLPLETITPEVLRAWKLRLSAKHKPGTVQKYMARLSAAFRVAVEDYGWLQDNPLRRVKKLTPSRGVVRFLSTDELPRLLAACRASRNPVLYPIVLLALATGSRKNEIRCLQWSQIDLDVWTVCLRVTKMGREHRLPVVGEALLVMQDWAQRRIPGVVWVFPRQDGQAPRRIESAWYTALKRAQVTNFRFHDLRHSCASYLAMSSASLRDIAEVLGHTDIKMTMRYTHLLPGHTAGVLERMAGQFLTRRREEE